MGEARCAPSRMTARIGQPLSLREQTVRVCASRRGRTQWPQSGKTTTTQRVRRRSAALQLAGRHTAMATVRSTSHIGARTHGGRGHDGDDTLAVADTHLIGMASHRTGVDVRPLGSARFDTVEHLGVLIRSNQRAGGPFWARKGTPPGSRALCAGGCAANLVPRFRAGRPVMAQAATGRTSDRCELGPTTTTAVPGR